MAATHWSGAGTLLLVLGCVALAATAGLTCAMQRRRSVRVPAAVVSARVARVARVAARVADRAARRPLAAADECEADDSAAPIPGAPSIEMQQPEWDEPVQVTRLKMSALSMDLEE